MKIETRLKISRLLGIATLAFAAWFAVNAVEVIYITSGEVIGSDFSMLITLAALLGRLLFLGCLTAGYFVTRRMALDAASMSGVAATTVALPQSPSAITE